MDITVHRTYCPTHHERDHYLDADDHCYGPDLKVVEALGYSWPRHIGGGWYRLIEKYPGRYRRTSDLDRLAEEMHQNELELKSDPELDF